MSHVTAATSRKLKEAGFPQPLPQEGQVWYVGRKQSKTTIRQSENYRGMLIADTYIIGGKFSEIADFAPTATDILRELGKDFRLSIIDATWFVEEDKFGSRIFRHENPAEACAAAWLYKNGSNFK